MSPSHAAVLGALQGLGEFLPISSSGHLIVAPWLLGWPIQSLAFDVALHAGTLFAVVAAFGSDWARLLAAGARGLASGQPFSGPDARLLWLLGLATLPGAAAGLLVGRWADSVFRSPLLVAATMAVMGAVLLLADRLGGQRRSTAMSVAHAALIGMAQAAALVPGVSRSGATISMALLLGYQREEAARFSFLLAVPITAAATIARVPSLLQHGGAGAALLGAATAAVFGFVSIRFLLVWVRARDYRIFAFYRFAFAALVASVWLVRGQP